MILKCYNGHLNECPNVFKVTFSSHVISCIQSFYTNSIVCIPHSPVSFCGMMERGHIRTGAPCHCVTAPCE